LCVTALGARFARPKSAYDAVERVQFDGMHTATTSVTEPAAAKL